MNVKFNPETASFSQIQTIKTWLDEKYQTKKTIKKIQKHIALEVHENPHSLYMSMPIKNNEGDNNYYGKTFFAQPGIELPCLQFIKELSKTKNNFVGLELASGFGLVSWKYPYASGGKGTFYVNDLSIKMMELFDTLINGRLDNNQKMTIVKIPGDCFKILESHPELKGSVNFIVVKNLEHFFNPKQHQAFISLISDLLAPNGKAFLTAQALPPLSKEHPLFKLYFVQKEEKNLYPGFIKYQTVFQQCSKSTGLIGDYELSNIERPKDDERCYTKTVSKESLGFINTKAFGYTELFKITQEVVTMHFEPTVYTKIIAHEPSLEVEEGFFIDHSGHREKKFSKQSSHCAIILNKKDITLEKKMMDLNIEE